MIGWCTKCGREWHEADDAVEHDTCAPIRRPYCHFHMTYDCMCPYLPQGPQVQAYRARGEWDG